MLCIARSPFIALPPECSPTETLGNATNNTLVLILDRTWPRSLSVTAFIATLECAFNGSLPDFTTPIAYSAAPRFSLGSAVRTNRLPSTHLVLGRLGAIRPLLSGTLIARSSTARVGVVPILFVDDPLPRRLTWQPLDRNCAVHRARHPRRHATLCAMSSGSQPSTPFLTTAKYVDCDWAIGYYRDAEEHALPLEGMRFFFHMPGSLKTDLLVAIAGVASAYTTVLYMDEDIVIPFNSTDWETELRCAFGHVPVVWRPTFRPYSDSIWRFMNADCFKADVRAVAIGNFTFLEPQVVFVRADFYIHFIDQYVEPVFAERPKLRSIWTLLATICTLAEHSFPNAVPCAMTLALTVEHADLRTLRKGGRHMTDSFRVQLAGLRRFGVTRFELAPFEVVKHGQPCAPLRAIGAGRFEPWQPFQPNRTIASIRRMLNQRARAKQELDEACLFQTNKTNLVNADDD